MRTALVCTLYLIKYGTLLTEKPNCTKTVQAAVELTCVTGGSAAPLFPLISSLPVLFVSPFPVLGAAESDLRDEVEGSRDRGGGWSSPTS